MTPRTLRLAKGRSFARTSTVTVTWGSARGGPSSSGRPVSVPSSAAATAGDTGTSGGPSPSHAEPRGRKPRAPHSPPRARRPGQSSGSTASTAAAPSDRASSTREA